MNVTVLYVGSSLLAPLKDAERELNREYKLDLRLSAFNFGAPFSDKDWFAVESDLTDADLVFVIHVMDGENAARLIPALENHKERHQAVIVINCMPDLMRRTRMGRLDISQLLGRKEQGDKGEGDKGKREREKGKESNGSTGK